MADEEVKSNMAAEEMESDMPKVSSSILTKVKPVKKRVREISPEESAEEEEAVQELGKFVQDTGIEEPFSDHPLEAPSVEEDGESSSDGEDIPEHYEKPEYKAFIKAIENSRGYNVPLLPPYLRVTPKIERSRDKRTVIRLAKIAIKKYNRRHGTEYLFNRVTKGNCLTDPDLTFFITFLVKDLNAESIEFQAKVIYGVKAITVMECHPTPMPTTHDYLTSSEIEIEDCFSDYLLDGEEDKKDAYFSIKAEEEDEVEYDSDDFFAPYSTTYYGRNQVEKDYQKPEYIAFARAILESRGYDVPQRPPKLRVDVTIVPVIGQMKTLRKLSRIAITKYNGRYRTGYKLDNVIKANRQVYRGLMYYITFVAVDGSDGQPREFQARVLDGLKAIHVIECHRKVVV